MASTATYAAQAANRRLAAHSTAQLLLGPASRPRKPPEQPLGQPVHLHWLLVEQPPRPAARTCQRRCEKYAMRLTQWLTNSSPNVHEEGLIVTMQQAGNELSPRPRTICTLCRRADDVQSVPTAGGVRTPSPDQCPARDRAGPGTRSAAVDAGDKAHDRRQVADARDLSAGWPFC